MRHERNALVKLTDRLRRRGYAARLEQVSTGVRSYRNVITIPGATPLRIKALQAGWWGVYALESYTTRGYGAWDTQTHWRVVHLYDLTTEELDRQFN